MKAEMLYQIDFEEKKDGVGPTREHSRGATRYLCLSASYPSRVSAHPSRIDRSSQQPPYRKSPLTRRDELTNCRNAGMQFPFLSHVFLSSFSAHSKKCQSSMMSVAKRKHYVPDLYKSWIYRHVG